MLERQLSYEALHAAAETPEPQWLFRRHIAEFSRKGALQDNALYLELAAKVRNFACVAGSKREGQRLWLPLRSGFLRTVLEGSVLEEFVSAEKGERRSHLWTKFSLPRDWQLHLNQVARQELVSGRVRLSTEIWFKPGHTLSFRWIFIVKALRWALESSLKDYLPGETYGH